MKIKERIAELRGLASELTDYQWCKHPMFTGKALNDLYNTLGLFRGDEYSNHNTHKNMKKYKYAEQKLLDYITANVGTIVEFTIEEKDKVYSEILNKAVEDYENVQTP